MTDTETDTERADNLPAPTEPRKVAAYWVASKRAEPGALPRIAHQHDEWLRYTGTHWAPVDATSIREDVYLFTEDAVYLRPMRGQTDTFEAVPWAPNARKVADVLDAAVGLVHLDQHVQECTWLDGRDDTATYVPCRNGRVNVETGQREDHDLAFYNRHVIPTDYDPAAVEPAEWLKFIGEVLDDDRESIELLQEWLGYVVSGRTDQQKMMGLIGEKRSGKGTILRIIAALVGHRNNVGTTLPAFSTNFGLQAAVGKASITIGDVRDTGGVNNKVIVERILSITGEDVIQIDRKNREPWSGKLGARITLASNQIPAFVDSANAIGSRFLFLHFPHSKLGEEDLGLGDRLEAELAGILAWSLEGLRRLQRRGRFVQPQRSAHLVRQFASTASTISEWLQDHAEIDPAAEVAVQDAYDAYRLWAHREGNKPATKARFGQQLQSVLPHLDVVRRGGKGAQTRTYTGFTLNAAGVLASSEFRARD